MPNPCNFFSSQPIAVKQSGFRLHWGEFRKKIVKHFQIRTIKTSHYSLLSGCVVSCTVGGQFRLYSVLIQCLDKVYTAQWIA
ncbi:hypothetical protein BL250_12445 [Erwinia sp. OLTSP20]|nr:hypothetical protein BMF91_23970 [Serratia sp. OLFL2]PIJ49363.1 hypothetical protein BV501_13065 [Erwinia sp. OAMSP11]PIJ69758.1 hypothetical protein BK416_13895 [Erwinia sp. OLSSP12]PIJ76242.1 hypothetical protein BLD47_18150 [Erwinia sp. OLCASP19]PIJ76725.1 hypothetical protein BLD46_18150 [Erwinia sp. OLMTSP26]PIJ78965.1 hypothetical protein BLD49_17800 [Erwinia sp. OLMDSP33]PIJ89368.1 hypothetical protein BL249_16640 [Erwinia sp. OLFS4]PIJ91351.1 hypothetical protein BL250_12445 [Erwi